MPRPLKTRDKLGQRTVTFDEEMRRHPKLGNALEIGVLGDVQAVLEKRLDLAGGKLRRWQADVVNHQQ
ncbi:hypothetical protein D3C86_2128640 [compost metagenome]